MKKIKISEVCDKPMWDIWMSAYHLSSITVAHQIGLFQALSKEKLSRVLLGKKLGVNNRAISILTNILTCLGFLIYKNNKFSLSPVSKTYLLPDSLFYWGPQLNGLRDKLEHQQLLNAIYKNSEQLTFKNKSFTDMWETGKITQEAAINFTEKMHATIFSPALHAVQAEAFAKIKHLLDMGGGAGSFCIAYIKKYPKSKATVFDLPEVCKVTNNYLKKFNATKKISIEAGNFFKTDWPKGADGVLFSQIFHDWTLEKCTYLTKKAYDILSAGGQILIHEMLINNKSALTVACFDLLMFVNHQSQQFTKQELFDLLRSTGFKKPKMTKTFGYYSIISATK